MRSRSKAKFVEYELSTECLLCGYKDSSQRATADGLEHHSVPFLQARVHPA